MGRGKKKRFELTTTFTMNKDKFKKRKKKDLTMLGYSEMYKELNIIKRLCCLNGNSCGNKDCDINTACYGFNVKHYD